MMFIPEGIALRGQRRKLGTGAHTLRDKSRLEMAERQGIREVAASPSKMTGDGHVTKDGEFRAFRTSRFSVNDCRTPGHELRLANAGGAR